MAEELEGNEEEVIEETNLTEESLYEMNDDEFEAALATAEAEEASVEVEDNNEDELEQPSSNEDSDSTSEDDDDDDESEEDSEDGDSTEEPTEEQSEAEEEKSETEAQPVVKKRVYKANGKDFEFTDDEVFDQFGTMFGQAMNYTQKMQALAPYKGMMSAIKEENLKPEDMNLMIDVLKGDKEATAALLKRTGVDALDLDVEQEQAYQPTSYGRNDTELAIQEVVENISGDQEYMITHDVIENQWDKKSQEAFVGNPEYIKKLHEDVKSGVYDKVSPAAMKLKVMDGGKKSDIEYYVQAGKNYYTQKATDEARAEVGRVAKENADMEAQAKITKAKAEEAKRVATKDASKKRKAATPTKSRASKPSAIDYMNTDLMSDDDFDKFMSKHLK